MSFLSFLLGEKKKSAAVAKERLQIILAHERGLNARRPDYLPQLQRELLAVISKYVSIKAEDIKVNLEKQDALEVLEVKIELPDLPATAVTPTPPAR
ncbi:cell division topological specificity factor MinE [Pseudacidovorax sp. RU35E]|uniref:cell division topological specificity factor MinE n=1 Tax=Pseudacidovorax sp. RU35E TaxID=1907403 RepID=UPI0009572986|nr:cell division topological specificity factor MinE [Pseudacidovorax sp. RU35E]SIQ32629.1 cell division topological specificity factor MinE [Pseudacidovorax sp. RU35E]